MCRPLRWVLWRPEATWPARCRPAQLRQLLLLLLLQLLLFLLLLLLLLLLL